MVEVVEAVEEVEEVEEEGQEEEEGWEEGRGASGGEAVPHVAMAESDSPVRSATKKESVMMMSE